ncbi:Qat anti-phage system TatD family nuclease QatD [Brevundimonas sp. EYE_349]|uniref:Qat anti-phage system TatD family nuclease QatD n=1 Tax=Brevundimonas sp. EYE_349 TaxID=2853455 RepID=UPI0020034461|nr:Qat anti-phage system TatD family nuclease QatD [Brevundimonas sp. EYE_349]MCK6104245.1 TatD family hydrolase [Brevundimonas sp. EYE_349]
MAIVDFHCHLDLFPDPQAVACEVANRGVYALSVTTTPSAFLGTAALAPPNSRIRTALGLHPELAAARAAELPLFETLLSKTAYVGEVGLDGSRPHRDTLDIQTGILMDILILCARAGGKTISLHSRDAARLVLDLLEAEPLAGRPVLHWFVGSPREIARAAEIGCWFSVGPAMLRSDRARRAVALMPRDKLLPETDGPFGLNNGKPLYPWEASLVVPVLAQLWAEPESAVTSQLENNFRKLSALSVATPSDTSQ